MEGRRHHLQITATCHFNIQLESFVCLNNYFFFRHFSKAGFFKHELIDIRQMNSCLTRLLVRSFLFWKQNRQLW